MSIDTALDTAGWELVGKETQYQNPHVECNLITIKTPHRQTPCTWTVVHRKKGVAIAPITTDGKLLLVHQERIPLQQTLWEFPAGQIDETKTPSSELVIDTCLRELREETGYELPKEGELIPLGYFFTSQGFTDERLFLFAGRGVVPHEQGREPDEHEVIHHCKAFTLAEVRQMIINNVIRDGNSLALFARMSVAGLV